MECKYFLITNNCDFSKIDEKPSLSININEWIYSELIETKYIKEKRMNLGGFLPERTTYSKPIKAPAKDIFDFMKVSTGEKKCLQPWH